MTASLARQSISIAALVALIVSHAGGALATPDARAQAEIDQLLAFVAKSGCTFIRNGAPHSSEAARDHLQQKFLQARGALTTADQFVTAVASRSSTTGEPYRVRCSDRESDAGPWLAAELKRLRASK